MTIKRALISVSDKSAIEDFARGLEALGVEILSTGGSAQLLAKAQIPVREVADYTGFPEMLDGRVKTLHPKIHGGLLGRRDNPQHVAAMQQHNIGNIDLLVVNLYPFEQTVARGAGFDECVENIDIGGPAMIRSAAKNHQNVTVIVDPADYEPVLQEMRQNNGAVSDDSRRRLAAKAFARTAAYDRAIADWFGENLTEGGNRTSAPSPQGEGNGFPRNLTITATLKQTLRYGENPHQQAAFYITDGNIAGVASARQIQGKELSYNNINDTDAAFALVSEFTRPACAIIKHANPCGVALADTQQEAFTKALACDPTSAYGGILAFNRKLELATTEAIGKLFAEVIIAPDAEAAALERLSKKKNLRLLLTDPDSVQRLRRSQNDATSSANPSSCDNSVFDTGECAGSGEPTTTHGRFILRQVAGGLLLQEPDELLLDEQQLKIVSTREPSPVEMADLRFAFAVAKHVKSNAIVLVKEEATIGIGAGQMSRVDSVRIACHKAEDAGLSTKGAVLASDAFFPFDDNVKSAAAAGITAIIQPGGSIRDEEVIAAADRHDIAMVFTAMRHFRH